MPKFRPPKEQVLHLESIKCSWRFSSLPTSENPGKSAVCQIVDSEGKDVPGAIGQAAEHNEAFNIAFEKVKEMGPPKTAGELAAENAMLRAKLAAKDDTSADDAPRRGRGRPPGSPNKPKEETKTELGAGPTNQQGDTPDA